MSDLAVRPCPKCELSLDPKETNTALHLEHCIGETPWVLHNRKAGMVVYLSEEEYVAMQEANHAAARGEHEPIPTEMTARIAARAVYGILEGH